MNLDPSFTATAIESVLRAGEAQLAGFGRATVSKKGRIDLVTNVDVEVEVAFRSTIADRFPNHRVLGEELQVDTDASDSTEGHCWVFDPVDGTTNYVHGLPFFCSSLALEVDGRVEIGAVFDPLRQELFVAERGRGARLNGRPIHVSEAAGLGDAMLCTGFPYDVHETVAEVVDLFGRFVGRSRAVRRLGSAALDLCYVACGRLDGFWERRLGPWDIAAGALLVEEAGGRTTLCDGSLFSSRAGEVIASNGPIHDDMLETIATWSRDRASNRTN